MPTEYEGDPDAAIPSPPVISIPSDGDKRKAASVNPAFQALADGLAKFLEYGGVVNAPNTWDEQNTFTQLVTFTRAVKFSANTRRAGTVASLSDIGDQTINPNTQATNIYRAPLATGSPRIVRLDTSGVFDGDWVRVFWNVAAGGGVWRFRRGADDAQNIATVDTTNFIAEVDAAVMVEFERISGLWRLVGTGQGVIPGAYA